MTLLWWAWTAAGASACDLGEDVAAAYDAWARGEHDIVDEHLLRAEKSLACGSVADPEDLARFWLVEGAMLARAGDPGAAVSLSAARRMAPELWLDLGEDVRDRWLLAEPEPGEGELAFDFDHDRPIAVDGAPFGGGAMAAGLHAVQVADPDGAVRYGAVVYVGASTVTNVVTGLQAPALALPSPAPPPAPAPAIAERPAAGSSPTVAATIRVVTGMSLALGEELSAPSGDRTLTEPAAKIVVPVGIAAGARVGSLWARGEAGIGWLVGGTYLSVLADGTPHQSPVRVDLGGSAGVGPVGVASGIQWPGRLYQRALLAVHAPRGAALRWVAEVRGGFNVATDRPIEPAFEVLLGVNSR
jgi:hypothetical protein